MAGAAEGAGLGGPGGAAAEDGQVRGCERGPGRAARLPEAGAGRLRAVAAGQVPGGGPECRGGQGAVSEGRQAVRQGAPSAAAFPSRSLRRVREVKGAGRRKTDRSRNRKIVRVGRDP